MSAEPVSRRRPTDELLTREQDGAIEKLALKHESILVRQPFPGPVVVWGLDELAPCAEHEAIIWPRERPNPCACSVGRHVQYIIGCDGTVTRLAVAKGGPVL